MRDLARDIGRGKSRDDQRDDHDRRRVLDDVLSTLARQGAADTGCSSRPARRSHLVHRQLAST
jgi:hypothetical protein